MDGKTVMLWILIVAATVSSLISVVITVIDKINAKRHGQRISEATLIFTASFGGAAAMFLTMLILNHKTRHARFMVGLPFMILFQVLAGYLVALTA